MCGTARVSPGFCSLLIPQPSLLNYPSWELACRALHRRARLFPVDMLELDLFADEALELAEADRTVTTDRVGVGVRARGV